MKKFIYLLLFSFALLLAMPPTESKAMAKQDPGTCFVVDNSQIAPVALVQEQETGGVATDVVSNGQGTIEDAGIADFLKTYWVELLFGLLGFFEVIVRLTPTEKDNSILNWIVNLLNVFNLKKGGGTFGVSSK